MTVRVVVPRPRFRPVARVRMAAYVLGVVQLLLGVWIGWAVAMGQVTHRVSAAVVLAVLGLLVDAVAVMVFSEVDPFGGRKAKP